MAYCSDASLSLLFSFLMCTLRFGNNVLTPLYLDSLNPTDHAILNISGSGSMDIDPADLLPSGPSWERIDPFFAIWLSMGFDTVLLGTIVACIMICSPGSITEREKSYPKYYLMMAGGSQAFSALLFQFSTSGSRTAPFLYGALGYFYVPIAFVLRFLILGKRPNLTKIVCAVIVVIAEFVSLIPTIFPQLESDSARNTEGGATGIGRILWPICFVASGIPHAVWNILLEKSVKTKKDGSDDVLDIRRLNFAYIMFFNFLGTFLTTLLLFWVDLIPGFGLLPSISIFWKQFLFNFKCVFGATEKCGLQPLVTGWGRMICKTGAFMSSGMLLRYSEGANFYAILSALIQPFRFLFFTIFDEQPFRWNPHATLSTWLSIVALAVMFPAVVIYSRSPEITASSVEDALERDETIEVHDDDGDDDTSPLVPSMLRQGSTGSINMELPIPT